MDANDHLERLKAMAQRPAWTTCDTKLGRMIVAEQVADRDAAAWAVAEIGRLAAVVETARVYKATVVGCYSNQSETQEAMFDALNNLAPAKDARHDAE
jgi:hypothetical protein